MKPARLLKYFLVFGVLYFTIHALASTEEISASRDITSSDSASSASIAHSEIYKINDGYGEYTGEGKTKIQAQSGAREACINAKVNMYESRHGVTPDADTADLMIDSCINK
jgi:hypothetical protein